MLKCSVDMLAEDVGGDGKLDGMSNRASLMTQLIIRQG